MKKVKVLPESTQLIKYQKYINGKKVVVEATDLKQANILFSKLTKKL
jgi:hypothetical protein